MSELPEIGIHRNIDFATYAKWPAINSGALKWGRCSPKHLKAALDGRITESDTESRKFGRAVHMRLLEPERYEAEVVVSENCSGEYKTGKLKGKRCKAAGNFYDGDKWWCGTHNTEGVIPEDYVSRDEARRIERMAEALKDNPVMSLFKRPGWSEVSIVWEEDGLTFKGRIDRYSQGDIQRGLLPMVMDIKKTQTGKADRASAEKSIANYQWFWQMALYCRGMEALTGMHHDAVWLFVEDDEPFDINPLPIDERVRQIADLEINDILKRYRAALKAGVFPGYVADPSKIERGGLPAWKHRQYADNELAEAINDN